MEMYLGTAVFDYHGRGTRKSEPPGSGFRVAGPKIMAKLPLEQRASSLASFATANKASDIVRDYPGERHLRSTTCSPCRVSVAMTGAKKETTTRVAD